MSTGSSQNQTLSFLLGWFKEAGIRPRTALGQNFLIDLNLQRFLLDTAELESDDVVFEVGTGTGSLTALMAPKVAGVVTVELDRNLFRMAGELLEDAENVRMLQLDVLKNKNHFQPEVLEVIRKELSARPGLRLKLVANLPFNVATPILANLLATDIPPATMTVTIQKELADRIVAKPSTKDYGSLSIWMQSQCGVEIARVMPPSVFWPRPKVTSAIMQITLRPELRRRITDLKFFHDFVRSMFFHRRKLLRSELLGAFKQSLEKPDVDRIMDRVGLSPMARAEELDVPTFLKLADTVRTEVTRD